VSEAMAERAGANAAAPLSAILLLLPWGGEEGSHSSQRHRSRAVERLAETYERSRTASEVREESAGARAVAPAAPKLLPLQQHKEVGAQWSKKAGKNDWQGKASHAVARAQTKNKRLAQLSRPPSGSVKITPLSYTGPNRNVGGRSCFRNRLAHFNSIPHIYAVNKETIAPSDGRAKTSHLRLSTVSAESEPRVGASSAAPKLSMPLDLQPRDFAC
jgi:hypothetical protein